MRDLALFTQCSHCMFTVCTRKVPGVYSRYIHTPSLANGGQTSVILATAQVVTIRVCWIDAKRYAIENSWMQ